MSLPRWIRFFNPRCRGFAMGLPMLVLFGYIIYLSYLA